MSSRGFRPRRRCDDVALAIDGTPVAGEPPVDALVELVAARQAPQMSPASASHMHTARTSISSAESVSENTALGHGATRVVLLLDSSGAESSPLNCARICAISITRYRIDRLQ